jgi:hypothetical protein
MLTTTWSHVERDPDHLADLDSGDPDLVHLLQTCGLAEVGLVDLSAPDDRQPVGRERAQEQDEDGEDADSPDDGLVALPERRHRWHLGALLTIDTCPISRPHR